MEQRAGKCFSWSTLIYGVTVATLTLMAATPYWLTDLLPMMDYPPLLTFVRAFQDYKDPSSPFYGTYTTAWPISPLVLPLLLMRGLAALSSIEIAGKVLWTAYSIALPAASVYLLHVLRRNRWCVLLVFPLVLSYWVSGGFFAYATASPLVVLGLAMTVRWFEERSFRRGLGLSAIAIALLMWHALPFAQLLLDFGVLWVLFRAPRLGDRLKALLPIGPPLVLFAVWLFKMALARPAGEEVPGDWAAWPPFLENAAEILDFIGMMIPNSSAYVFLFGFLILLGAIAESERPRGSHDATGARFRVENPFAVLSLVSVACYLFLPSYCLGVEGINNRHPWVAALLFVFAWNLPARRLPKALLLGAMAAGSGLLLVHLCGRFAAFHEESVGASRLINKMTHGQTLLAPIDEWGATEAFPGKPLRAVQEIATVRHGSLPNSSYAGYGMHFIQYVRGKNPMPGLGLDWLSAPGLTRFDYVLLRSPPDGVLSHTEFELFARDGAWELFAVRK